MFIMIMTQCKSCKITNKYMLLETSPFICFCFSSKTLSSKESIIFLKCVPNTLFFVNRMTEGKARLRKSTLEVILYVQRYEKKRRCAFNNNKKQKIHNER